MSDDLLKQHRDAIDSIDAHILALINERASHAQRIGEIKGGDAVDGIAVVFEQVVGHDVSP